jgi:hypothetical protein
MNPQEAKKKVETALRRRSAEAIYVARFFLFRHTFLFFQTKPHAKIALLVEVTHENMTVPSLVG